MANYSYRQRPEFAQPCLLSLPLLSSLSLPLLSCCSSWYSHRNIFRRIFTIRASGYALLDCNRHGTRPGINPDKINRVLLPNACTAWNSRVSSSAFVVHMSLYYIYKIDVLYYKHNNWLATSFRFNCHHLRFRELLYPFFVGTWLVERIGVSQHVLRVIVITQTANFYAFARNLKAQERAQCV